MARKTKKYKQDKQHKASKQSEEQTVIIDEQLSANSSSIYTREVKRLIYGIIVILTFAVYWNALPNDYALDDAIVITQNEFTKQGIDGIDDLLKTEVFTGFFGYQKNLVAGSRYRPLSLITFAIEYQFFGLNPFISHFINIALYALTCIVLFNILIMLLGKYSGKHWYASLPFVAVVLFIVHPLHTEVVTNIKGRDEIFTLLGSLLALLYSLRFLNSGKVKNLILSFVVFFLALTSKENAVTFFAIIPLTVLFFTRHSIGRNLITLAPMILATIIYFGIRQSILGGAQGSIPQELMNDSFMFHTTSEKFASIMLSFGWYYWLLFFPINLTFDYYPYMVPIVGWGDWRVLISLLLTIVPIAFALLHFFRVLSARINKKEIEGNPALYGILFYFLTFSIVSNLLFPIGTLMSERFMFIPSIGFVIAIAWVITVLLKKVIRIEKTHIILILGFLVIAGGLYGFRTLDRNVDWDNDYTLFTNDVEISGNSAKSNTSAGGKIAEELEKLRKFKDKEYASVAEMRAQIEAESYMRSSEIDALFQDASTVEQVGVNIDQYIAETYPKSIAYLEQAVKIHGTYADALLLLGNAHYQFNKNYEETIKYYKRILDRNPRYEKVYTNLEIVMSGYEDINRKIEIYEDFYRYNPNNYHLNYKLGLMYGESKISLTKALEYLETAVKINPRSYEAYKALGAGYGEKGDFRKSIDFSEKAASIKPEDQQLKVNIGLTYKFLGVEEFNKNKNYEAAVDCFEKALLNIPNDPQIFQNLGLSYQQLGNIAKANENFAKAQKLMQ